MTKDHPTVTKIARRFGFEKYPMGGGCMAYVKELPNDWTMLITCTDGTGIPEEEDGLALLGTHNHEGEQQDIEEVSIGDLQKSVVKMLAKY